MKEDFDTIGVAIGRIPSGCSVLTAKHNGSATGVLVSWIQQAAFEPPCLSMCLKQGRAATKLIDDGQRFMLNVVGEDPAAMFKHFGKGFSPEEDAFTGLSVRDTEFGPVIESCIAHLGCKVVNKVSVGDHDLYVAEVVAAGVVEDARSYVHLRKTAHSY